ncbi:hypothetical protein H8356DRAFT_1691647 [Neocallimastix lanati (nom. inval.)]|jgi:hypothetical protein|nr:hypothetical protein H8356DRAFT_1691647 [Neocallimastix sp. JGI-2020a]
MGWIIPFIKSMPRQWLHSRDENEDELLTIEGFGSYKSLVRSGFNSRFNNNNNNNNNNDKNFNHALGSTSNINMKISPVYSNTNGNLNSDYDDDDDIVMISSDINNIPGSLTEKPSSTNIQYSQITYSDNGFKEGLEPFETYLYNNLLLSCKKKVPEFFIDLYPSDDGYKVNYKNMKTSMITAFISFLYDHSEFWWIYTYRYSCEYSSRTENVTRIEIDLCWSNDFCNNFSQSTIQAMNEVLETQKFNIIENIGDPDHKTSYQILRNVHDQLINSVTIVTDDESEDIFSPTIYGALVNHKCTSEGIAKAFNWFSNYYKINSILAVGYGYQWNFVKLNEKWYVIDVTGDALRSTKNNISYDLFLIGYSDITNDYDIVYEKDITYNLIDRVKSTSNSITFVTYPTIDTNNFFITNNISKDDIFESTIISITSDTSYDNEVVPDSTNNRITTLISTFTTTVVTVIQGNLDLEELLNQIKENYQCDLKGVNLANINNNYYPLNQKYVAKTNTNNSNTSGVIGFSNTLHLYKNIIILSIAVLIIYLTGI